MKNLFKERKLNKEIKELEAEMRQEAVRRLKTMEPDDFNLAGQFEKDGTVYVQDTSVNPKREGPCIRRANKAEMDVVHFMEDEQGNLPYFIIKTDTVRFETLYFFLYVGYDKRNWELEGSAIREMFGRKYVEPRIFEVNAGIRPDDDERPIDLLNSRFTTIKYYVDGKG